MTNEMAEHWAAQSEAYNLLSFASDKAYREADRGLIERAFAHLPSRFFHVDVASGTGLVPWPGTALPPTH